MSIFKENLTASHENYTAQRLEQLSGFCEVENDLMRKHEHLILLPIIVIKDTYGSFEQYS